MPNTIFPESTFLVALRILLFLGCRKYLLRSLYSDLQTLSSSDSTTPDDDDTPPATPSPDSGIELSSLPAPVTTPKSSKGKDSSRSDAHSLHASLSRAVFSLMFAESSMMFFVLMLQGLDVFSPRTRQLSWHFSLIFIMTIILVAVPLCISLILALSVSAKTSSSSTSRRHKYLLGPRICLSLIPVLLYLFALSKIPLPPALIASNVDIFTASLARLIVLGTLILGLLSGFGAVSTSWAFIPWLSPSRGVPTDQDVATAEYTLQSVRNDLRDRRAAADQQRRASAHDTSTSWFARLTPNFRGGDGLSQELRGLEALEYQMSRNVEALRARRDAAKYARTFRGRLVNAGAGLFAVYCVLRIVSCLINVLLPSRRAAAQSQTDLIADLLARALEFLPGSRARPDPAKVASLARQLSLALVGLIILTSVRRVLRGATRALRVTSRNLGASLMMLLLAQLMGIYLLSTIVQLRNSFPPPPAPPSSSPADADVNAGEANLFSTIPPFEVFGALFDWAVLLAAGASVLVRWGHERVNGVEDI
ncbi:putative the Golgi pH regulator (GPHR) family N-terminal [Lyophyllum shimeji]|uniref:The Golgi pH regulator (GPHR) family N-terminal n=1 Tax=Lyophyllum shimeji TaxID=47721 RepID=A0A9P3PWS4_LYOSH|nr:putative the Golgi pH regulator (GPHR) family N-terminal [Lyophyllum shimeji]